MNNHIPLNLEDEIIRLKKEHNAIILAHYYQEDDIQDIADFIGDSLELSRKAAATDAEMIVFCGVRFMAEVAKILSPQKKVVIPDMKAGCSLEDSCPPVRFREFKALHPDHIVLSYINCSAEVKALSDIIVTSSSAEKIINQLSPEQKIIFAPDKYLGGYLNKKLGRDMLLWNGSCYVHERFSEMELVKLMTRYPKAHVIAHPECPESLLNRADFVGSTSKLLEFTKQRQGEEFIILTESGIIHQMKKYNPDGIFHGVAGAEGGACISCNNCGFMKMNTMEKIYLAMKNGFPEIILSEEVRIGAKKSLDRMLEMA